MTFTMLRDGGDCPSCGSVMVLVQSVLLWSSAWAYRDDVCAFCGHVLRPVVGLA